jgi:hypothetical protein
MTPYRERRTSAVARRQLTTCLLLPPSLTATGSQEISPVLPNKCCQRATAINFLTNIPEPRGHRLSGDEAGLGALASKGRCVTGIKRADTANVNPIRILFRANCVCRHANGIDATHATRLTHDATIPITKSYKHSDTDCLVRMPAVSSCPLSSTVCWSAQKESWRSLASLVVVG